MKKLLLISTIFWISVITFATEQTPDVLIYKSDTIFIDFYPLEKLMKSDSIIRNKIIDYSDTTCMSSSCWRGHIGTWKIENDSLFLIELVNGCEDYRFSLEQVFGKQKVNNKKVFANWVTKNIGAVFGEFLRFDVENWESIYSNTFYCDIKNGHVTIAIIDKKSDCEKASLIALNDFEDSNYSLHSLEFVPPVNSYTYVLDKYYNIKWFFTDSIEYYNCYDSVMTINLKTKYGADFLEQAKLKADSLEQSENWNSNAEYIGGQMELMKYILSRLKFGDADTIELKTKLHIKLEIDSTGKAINPFIIKGISENVDKQVIEIINGMPNWKPAYLNGKPIRQKYYIPMNINYQ
nr:energy transducer TonB [uncultured Carboxylicivirga sp.]